MVIPAIDLIDGKVVRLYQGDYAQKTQYQMDPVEVVHDYAGQGAKWLHIVDLTGAKDPKKRQLSLISDMVATGKMQFQAGGGIRDEADVNQLLDIGVSRVVIGSMAVKSPEKVQDWMQQYGAGKFVLALDVNVKPDGSKVIATHGWQEDSGVELAPLLSDFIAIGAQHVLCTDISKDGTLQGANVAMYQELVAQFPQVSWQASGGIGSLRDIQNVRDSGAQNVILGRALLEGKFTLKQAIDLWGQA